MLATLHLALLFTTAPLCRKVLKQGHGHLARVRSQDNLRQHLGFSTLAMWPCAPGGTEPKLQEMQLRYVSTYCKFQILDMSSWAWVHSVKQAADSIQGLQNLCTDSLLFCHYVYFTCVSHGLRNMEPLVNPILCTSDKHNISRIELITLIYINNLPEIKHANISLTGHQMSFIFKIRVQVQIPISQLRQLKVNWCSVLTSSLNSILFSRRLVFSTHENNWKQSRRVSGVQTQRLA